MVDVRRKERALFIARDKDIREIPLGEFSRIYLGSEYCNRLLPTQGRLKRVLAFCRDAKLGFTLVTPYCTDDTLRRLKALFLCLNRGTEVVFNDFGALELIRQRGLVPVLGRLLVSVFRDPRIPMHGGTHDSYYRSSNLQRSFIKFLHSRGVSRIELDNVQQGYDISFRPGVRASLYYPYVQSAVTRKCIFANLAQRETFFKVPARCRFECRNKVKRFSIPGQKEAIYVQGTRECYVNFDTKMFQAQYVDRLVWMSDMVLPLSWRGEGADPRGGLANIF